MSSIFKSVIAVAAVVAFTPSAAHAVFITGGDTRIAVSSVITDAGVTFTPRGTVSIADTDPLTLNIPISGGNIELDPPSGAINHFDREFLVTSGGTSLLVRNLQIDFGQSLVFGDALVGTDFVLSVARLFSFVPGDVEFPRLFDLDNPYLALTITDRFAGALTSVLGLPDLTGVEFGQLATAPDPLAVDPEPTPTPAPATLALFGLSALGLAAARRRRA